MHCAILALAADALGSPNEGADVPVNVQYVCACACVCFPLPVNGATDAPCKLMTDCWQKRFVTSYSTGRSGVTKAEFDAQA